MGCCAIDVEPGGCSLQGSEHRKPTGGGSCDLLLLLVGFAEQSCPANASPSPGSAPQTLPSRLSGSAALNKGPKAATWKNNQAVLLNHQSARPKENRPWKEFPFSLFPLFHFNTGWARCLSQTSAAVAAFAQPWQAPGRGEQLQGQKLSAHTMGSPLRRHHLTWQQRVPVATELREDLALHTLAAPTFLCQTWPCAHLRWALFYHTGGSSFTLPAEQKIHSCTQRIFFSHAAMASKSQQDPWALLWLWGPTAKAPCF